MSRKSRVSRRFPFSKLGAADFVSKLAKVALVAVMGLAVTPIEAQDEAQGETFSGDVEVRLIEVEVQVTDRKGHPLTGLKADQFELKVNGEKKEIEYFEAGIPAPSAVEASGTLKSGMADEPEPPLYLAIYVDRRFLQPGELDTARSDLRRFIEQTLKPEDRVLLASADGKGMDLLQSYTDDHQSVLEKLEGLDGIDGAGRLSANIATIMRDMRQELGFRSVIENAGDLPDLPDLEGGEAEAGDPAGASRRARQQGNPRAQLIQIDAFTDQINLELASVANQLSALVSTLTGLPGRKQVLYLGGTLPIRASYDLFQAWREVFDRSYDDSDFFRSSEQDGGDNNQRLVLDATAQSKRYLAGVEMFNKLAESAGAADVTFHTVNLAGLSRSRGLFNSASDVEIGRVGTGSSDVIFSNGGRNLILDDGLATLSYHTGGRHLSNTRKLNGYFAGLASDLKARYIVGFTADSQFRDSQEIEVKIKKGEDRRLRKALVRHRSRFQVKSGAVELAERTLAHLMMDTPTENPLGVSLEVGAPEPRAEDWQLKLKIRVPLSELVLVPDRRSHGGRLMILATAGALSQGFAPVMQTTVPVRLSNSDLLTALGREAEYELDLRVPEDPRKVSVTVRDDYSLSQSTVTAEVGKAEWVEQRKEREGNDSAVEAGATAQTEATGEDAQ